MSDAIHCIVWSKFDEYRDALAQTAIDAGNAGRPAALGIGMKEGMRFQHNEATLACKEALRVHMESQFHDLRGSDWRFWANHVIPSDDYGYEKAGEDFAVGWHKHKSLATGVLHVCGDGAFRARYSTEHAQVYPFKPGRILMFRLDLEHSIDACTTDRVSYALDAMP